jgi:predicted ribosome quality control (RQC) complex YloA/Tae2 family protein
MDYQLSALDINFLVKEFKEVLHRSKIEKIYQYEKSEFAILFHIPKFGKNFLRLSIPSFIHLTQLKEEAPLNPFQFCMALRKYLTNSYLIEVKQLGFERIIDFTFDTKNGNMHLIIEFFSKGNLFLTDENYIIKTLLEPQKWKERTLRGNVLYEYPKKEYNPFLINFEEFSSLIDNSKKESIVKTLAIDLGFGGRYSEEICFNAKIDKNKYFVDDNEKQKLYDSMLFLINSEIEPYVFYDNNIPVLISPILLNSIDSKLEKKKFNSFNETFDLVFSDLKITKEEKKSLKPFEKEKNKLLLQIKQQETHIETLEKEVEDNSNKGNILYNNYSLIEPLIKQMNELLKTKSQKEIKEIIKDHKIIKDINFKDKSVVIDVE